MTFTDDDLKRLKDVVASPGVFTITEEHSPKLLALLARMEAAEAYRDCATHLLEALVSYKKYIPEPYKQNPIYIIGSAEAEEEYKRVDVAWRKVAGK